MFKLVHQLPVAVGDGPLSLGEVVLHFGGVFDGGLALIIIIVVGLGYLLQYLEAVGLAVLAIELSWATGKGL